MVSRKGNVYIHKSSLVAYGVSGAVIDIKCIILHSEHEYMELVCYQAFLTTDFSFWLHNTLPQSCRHHMREFFRCSLLESYLDWVLARSLHWYKPSFCATLNDYRCIFVLKDLVKFTEQSQILTQNFLILFKILTAI